MKYAFIGLSIGVSLAFIFYAISTILEKKIVFIFPSGFEGRVYIAADELHGIKLLFFRSATIKVSNDRIVYLQDMRQLEKWMTITGRWENGTEIPVESDDENAISIHGYSSWNEKTWLYLGTRKEYILDLQRRN